MQKDGNDRSLALRDKPRLGVGIQNISNTNRGLSQRAKLLSQTLFRPKVNRPASSAHHTSYQHTVYLNITYDYALANFLILSHIF